MDLGIAGKRALVLGASKGLGAASARPAGGGRAVTRPTSPVRCCEWTGAGSDRRNEFGLDHPFNPRRRGPATVPQLDLESQVSDAGARRVSAGNNMVAEPAFFVPFASDRGYPRPRGSTPAMIHLAFNQ